jgi:hypothetical protein
VSFNRQSSPSRCGLEFSDLFTSKESLAMRFGQLAELRNAIRHSREVTSVMRNDGEAAIGWSHKPPPAPKTLDQTPLVVEQAPQAAEIETVSDRLDEHLDDDRARGRLIARHRRVPRSDGFVAGALAPSIVGATAMRSSAHRHDVPRSGRTPAVRRRPGSTGSGRAVSADRPAEPVCGFRAGATRTGAKR